MLYIYFWLFKARKFDQNLVIFISHNNSDRIHNEKYRIAAHHVCDSHSVHVASRSVLHKGVTDGRLVVGKVTMGAQISRNIMSLRGPVGATAAAAWAVACEPWPRPGHAPGPAIPLSGMQRIDAAPPPHLPRPADYVFVIFLAISQ